MTKADILIQIFAEVSGAPKQHVADPLSNVLRIHPVPLWHESLTDSEAEELLHGLREEAPGILAWLIEGAMMAPDSGDSVHLWLRPPHRKIKFCTQNPMD